MNYYNKIDILYYIHYNINRMNQYDNKNYDNWVLLLNILQN